MLFYEEIMNNLNDMSLRDLQKESARVLSINLMNNGDLSRFNKLAHHDSNLFYKAVIEEYIQNWGDLPSKIGPAKEVKLLIDD